MRKAAVSEGKAMLSTVHGNHAKDKSDYPTRDFALITSKLNVVNECKFDKSTVTVCWINMFLKVTGITTGGKKSTGKPCLDRQMTATTCDESTMSCQHGDLHNLQDSTKSVILAAAGVAQIQLG